jgi:hypothetical protein
MTGLFLAQERTAGQIPPITAAIPGVDPNYKVPKTPWGDPDLQGIYDGASMTPQARPEKYANREFLTAEEAAALEKAATDNPGRNARAERGTHADLEGAYNDVFTHRRQNYGRTRRTSLIIDPPDGKMPALTTEGQARQKAMLARRGPRGEGPPPTGLDGKPLPYNVDTADVKADNPEDRTPDRCSGVNTPAMASAQRLVQGPDTVMIYTEYAIGGGAYRTIDLKRRTHLPPTFRQKQGDSVGWWDGDTLVIETTNYSADGGYSGANLNLKLTERVTRVANDLILYRITADDPSTWVKPWTVEVPVTILSNKENQIYESACHEGNISLTGILAGARALEKEGYKPGAKPAAKAQPATTQPAGKTQPATKK